MPNLAHSGGSTKGPTRPPARIGVLGEVVVWGGDGQLVPIPPQLRRLLAILVAAEGASVSADRIAEHVTGGRFDSSAAKDLVLLLEHPIAFTEFADLDRAAAFFARESLPK